MVSCSNGHSVPDGAGLCSACGEDVRPRCQQGHAGTTDDRFCEICGSPLLPATLAAATSTPLLTTRDDTVAAIPPAVTPPPPVAPPPTFPPSVYGQTPGLSRVNPAAGAAVPDVRPQAPATTPVVGGAVAPFHFNARRLSRVDQITGGSSVVLIISLYLPWFGISSGSFSYSRSGMSVHTYLSFVLLIAVALVGYLVARSGWDRLPVRVPVAHAPLLLLLGGVQLLLVLLAFVLKPHGMDWEVGAWLGLLAAFGAALPVGIPAMQAWNATRVPH